MYVCLCFRSCISALCVFQVVSLEKFRSLQDKLLLLDFAVSAHDGNVITAVTFLKLKHQLINDICELYKQHVYTQACMCVLGVNLSEEDSL